MNSPYPLWALETRTGEDDSRQTCIGGVRRTPGPANPITPQRLKDLARTKAQGRQQLDMFDLLYEDASGHITSRQEVLALYSGQWEAFRKARRSALENTRIYLSICNDLDVYVATSMAILCRHFGELVCKLTKCEFAAPPRRPDWLSKCVHSCLSLAPEERPKAKSLRETLLEIASRVQS